MPVRPGRRERRRSRKVQRGVGQDYAVLYDYFGPNGSGVVTPQYDDMSDIGPSWAFLTGTPITEPVIIIFFGTGLVVVGGEEARRGWAGLGSKTI